MNAMDKSGRLDGAKLCRAVLADRAICWSSPARRPAGTYRCRRRRRTCRSGRDGRRRDDRPRPGTGAAEAEGAGDHGEARC